ncbi:MAG: GIY-YIG nuclease family protein [Promethearchaeia archaeon]
MALVYYVYIIETQDGTYYTGQTNDLIRRLDEHASGNSHSAKYLRMHPPKYLVHYERFESRSDAMRREIEIKQSRSLKERLIGERRDIEGILESYRESTS